MQRIWDGQFTRPVERDYRISLCTTCMGRLGDLSRTLPVNLELNRSYDNVEFVILDYNSRDGLGEWVRRNFAREIDLGRVVYLRTDEPRYFQMAHSRNVAFLAASGDIVCNVDADNFTWDHTQGVVHEHESCFAEYINLLANQAGQRAMFSKGKRMLRGRLGFFKEEFIHELGGYDEDLQGYGHDDHDLLRRAWGLGYELYWFGGRYVERLRTSHAQRTEHMEIKDWRLTERRNKERSAQNLAAGQFRANQQRNWGQARLTKNFEEEIVVGVPAHPTSDVGNTEAPLRP